MRGLLPILFGLALSQAGCGGDQSWTKDGSWEGDEGLRGDTSRVDPFDGEMRTLAPAGTAAPGAQTWFGVRHDLTMSLTTPRQAACGCVAAEVGMPGKQAFVWDGAVPEVGPDGVVVAISARGVDCPAEPDETKRRASISGVTREGDDVLLEIEDLPEGPPRALGAIIPKPGPTGAVYLVARDKKVPWLPHDRRCRVPSPVTSAPPP